MDELRKSAQDEYDSRPPEEKAETSVDKLYANNYYAAVSDQVSHNKDNKNIGGMGSSFSKGIDAATSIVTGLITGDITGGLAGASAPYLAEQIKLATGHEDPKTGEWKTDDKAANLTAHALLGAAVAIAQGNSALAGGAGAVTGEAAADIIRKALYGDTPVDKLSEAQKENISALSQLAVGLAVAAGTGGSTSDIGTAVAGSKNAVENNLLSNERGVEKLDKESKKLYDKIKDIVEYDEIDQLQKQYMNCQSDECRTTVYNDYYEKEQEVGQKLVDLYKSGQLTKADYEQLVTWYNDSMLEGVEQAKKEAGGYRKLWDIYDASSMNMTPTGLLGNPYLTEIRSLILLEQWRAEGLTESQIQEKFLKDGVLGAFGSGPDVNAIVHKIRNDGLSLEDGLMLASAAAFSKFTDKTAGAASTLHQKSKVEMDNLASQYNNKNLHPKDFTISVNGKALTTDKNASVGAPVFKGASDSDVMSYFKQLAGIDAMPTAKIIPGKGTIYSVKVTEGPNAGSSITLRDFSNSTSQTNAKWTIDIQNTNINKGNRVEVKFQ